MDLGRSVASFNAWINSSLFMSTALLTVGLRGKWRVGILDGIDLMGELCQDIDWLSINPLDYSACAEIQEFHVEGSGQ